MKRIFSMLALITSVFVCYRLVFSYYILIIEHDYTKHKDNYVFFFPLALRNPFKQNDLKEKINLYLTKDFNKRLLFLNPKDTFQRQLFQTTKELLQKNGFDIITMKRGEDRLPNVEKNLCVLVESRNCGNHYCGMVFVFDEKDNEIIDFY